MREQRGIFVDGRWAPSASSRTHTVVNPATEQPYGVFDVGTAADVDVAVVAADRALYSTEWGRLDLEERCEIVSRIAALMLERREELSRLHAETLGAPYSTGLHLGGAAALVDMYLAAVHELDLEYLRPDPSGATSLVVRKPVGVVAGILPWNTPLRSEVKKTVPALLAGCTVVLKPSLEGAFSSFAFAEICLEAGVPAGVVNVVPGDGATGEALVSHPLVRKIAFTGSTATGSRIASAAGPRFARLQLELGGKSAAIVLPDAERASTIPALVRGNWGNSGQLCVALSRVLVPHKRMDEIVEGLVEEAARQVVGDPFNDATTMGPLVTRTHRDKVLSMIDAGLEEGARLATGGTDSGHDQGWFVAPTVLSYVDPTMRIAQDEIFGPVISVIGYDSVDGAVRIANDSPYGLHGAVFGAQDNEVLEVARRLDTGSAAVNGFHLAASAPFGGVKQSGIGREHGPEGYDSFLEYVSYSVPAELAEKLAADGVPTR